MFIEQIRDILAKLNRVSIAVYGDYCLDAYWLMDPDGSEVSVETGLRAEAVAKHIYSPGGAGNVVANLAALNPAAIKAIGVIGDDIHGRELRSQLEALGADTGSMTIQEENFDTFTYTKKIYGEKEDPRIDFGLKNRRSEETDAALLKHITSALENHDALIFNQQVRGSIPNEEFIEQCNRLFKRFIEKIVVLDSRHYNALFRNVHRKTNEIEIAALSGRELSPGDYVSISDIKNYGTGVFEAYRKPVLVTCGARGMVCIDASGLTEVPGIQLLKKLDTVGAGDTVISAYTLCLAAGFPPTEAAAFANLAAAVTVQKLYTTGTATGEEILELGRDPDYNYQPELAGDLRVASYLPDTEIELCYPDIETRTGNIKHALFDHDGTISTLRQGWEDIMEPVMIKAILGDRYRTAGKKRYEEVRERVDEFINMSTGIQTILQMEALVGMVDEFNMVPKEKILDKFAYKQIYLDELKKVVSTKLGKLEKGLLNLEDFTMKGSVDFLKALKSAGVRLYLASGTDKQDVIDEARLLGYADLFDGGIYGSENDIKKYSKKLIINRIIKDFNLRGNELVVFGDGPVEIKECIKSGGIAVGIASDEVRRFGLNEEKRTRLVRSGAQIIVPDFSEKDKLLNLLIK